MTLSNQDEVWRVAPYVQNLLSITKQNFGWLRPIVLKWWPIFLEFLVILRTLSFSLFFCDFPHIFGHISGTTGPIGLKFFVRADFGHPVAHTKFQPLRLKDAEDIGRFVWRAKWFSDVQASVLYLSRLFPVRSIVTFAQILQIIIGICFYASSLTFFKECKSLLHLTQIKQNCTVRQHPADIIFSKRNFSPRETFSTRDIMVAYNLLSRLCLDGIIRIEFSFWLLLSSYTLSHLNLWTQVSVEIRPHVTMHCSCLPRTFLNKKYMD